MNFILVILDSLRQDHVGAYGNDWIQTPQPGPVCGGKRTLHQCLSRIGADPSFQDFHFDGTQGVSVLSAGFPTMRSYPYQDIYGTDKNLNIPGWSPIAKDDTTLAEFFHEHDFTSALVTDCLHQMYPGMNYHRGYHAWHWVRGQEWDMMRLHSLLRKNPEVAEYFTDKTDLNHPKVWEVLRNLVNTADRMYEEKYFAPQVFAQAERWLEEYYQDLDEDLFMCVDCFDPHEPWDTPRILPETVCGSRVRRHQGIHADLHPRTTIPT